MQGAGGQIQAFAVANLSCWGQLTILCVQAMELGYRTGCMSSRLARQEVDMMRTLSSPINCLDIG